MYSQKRENNAERGLQMTEMMKLVAEGRLKRQLKFNKIKPELALRLSHCSVMTLCPNFYPFRNPDI